QFITLSPEGILNDYTLPEDQLVIRGVAKKAGIANYEDIELNIPSLEAIAQAIRENEKGEAQEKKIEQELEAKDREGESLKKDEAQEKKLEKPKKKPAKKKK